jgi:hypothetical protein
MTFLFFLIFHFGFSSPPIGQSSPSVTYSSLPCPLGKLGLCTLAGRRGGYATVKEGEGRTDEGVRALSGNGGRTGGGYG